MVEKFDALEERGKLNPENIYDILVAIALLREQIASKTVLIEEYDFNNDFGVNSYLPFMNFLQNRDYGSIRRFILIHPTPISGTQWASCGNGVCPSQVLRTNSRLKCTPLGSLPSISRPSD